MSQRSSHSLSKSRESQSQERWSHDKYSKHNSGGYSRHEREESRHRGKNHHRQPQEDVMDARRQERERIGLIGVPQIWEKSPAKETYVT